MNESEIMGHLISGMSVILAIVSIYFTIVSAYIAALNYFLGRSPLIMKVVGFFMLSGALVFLGLSTVGVERAMTGLLAALDALPAREALPPESGPEIYFGLEAVLARQYEVGVWAGWVTAGLLYAALFYLTFVHRWRETS